MQCDLSSISYPQWAEEWINVRKLFASFYSVPRCGIIVKIMNCSFSLYMIFGLIGIKSMLQKLGLSFDGRPHSGLDDATNIARIVIELLKVRLFQDDDNEFMKYVFRMVVFSYLMMEYVRPLLNL